MRQSQHKVRWSSSTLADRGSDGFTVYEVVFSHSRVVLPNDVLQFTLRLTDIARHRGCWVLNLAGVRQFVSGWPRRNRVVLAESLLLHSKLQRFVFIDLAFLDSFGDSVPDLLSVVVSGTGQVKALASHLVCSLLSFESRRASDSQHTVELVSNEIFRFVLAWAKSTIHCLSIEAFD